ncbi:MAG: amino acid ABC transporter [Rhodobacteraceae bacterium]|nr:amino acid ABC transporter [Paracoccaceae bacterium]
MKKTLIAAALLGLTAVAAHAGDTVRIATEGLYPPYNLIDDQGKLAGYEVDLGNEICKRAALTCEFVQNDWDSMMPNLNSGNFDVIMAGMSITEERKKDRLFSENYMPPSVSYYVAKTADADIKGGIVAAQTATIQAAHVAETGAQLLEFKTPDETVAAVQNDEAVAVLADGEYLDPVVAGSNGALVIVDKVSLGDGVGAAFRQSDAELKGKFDKAISEMKADGSINELIKKWFKEKAVLF